MRLNSATAENLSHWGILTICGTEQLFFEFHGRGMKNPDFRIHPRFYILKSRYFHTQ